MPEPPDNLARDYKITREACDVLAAGSQREYAADKADGFFAGEIFAVEVPGDRTGPVKIGEADEHPDRRPTSPHLPCGDRCRRVG